MTYLLIFLAGCMTGILAKAVRHSNRMKKTRKLHRELHKKSRFDGKGYESWQKEVLDDRKRPVLAQLDRRV